MKVRNIIALVTGFFCAMLIGTVWAQGQMPQTQTTAHYKFTLTIGPLATMLMPEQAQGAKEGEVMVQMPGSAMPEMTMTDQGQPVNHHLEVQVIDLATNKVISDTMPTIVITDSASMSRTLSPVAAMYDVQVGQNDLHFGNNVYLAAGTYTIAVTYNNETGTFQNVAVADSGTGTAMPGTPTTMAMDTTPTTEAMTISATPTTMAMEMTPTPAAGSAAPKLPTTGGEPFGTLWLWALSGLLVGGLGLVFYRVSRTKV